MRIKIVYIDDVESELLKYKGKFEADKRTKDRFTITVLNTPKSQGEYESINKANPDLLLVDYDLATPDNKGQVIGFSGVTLATELRQKFPEIPIVLFTRKSVFKIENYFNMRETLSSIDQIIYKQDSFKEDLPILNELFNLATGFKILRDNTSKEWPDLIKLIGAPSDDIDLLSQCNPPVIPRRDWSASAVATWIRNVILKYPGLVYDPVHSATFLGISEDAFISDSVQSAFKLAKYSGIFPPSTGRWWKSTLRSVANSFMKKTEKNLPLREGFPAAWKRTQNSSLERSTCIFSGTSPAEWVCYILNKPVMIEYSLHYNPDTRPIVMDEARISFEAIKTSNSFDEKLFDPVGQKLIPEIKKMPKP